MGCQFLGQDFATSFEDAGFVICPFPYDSTASYGSGARNGPARILEASTQLELFDEELEISPYKAGIHTLPMPEVPVEPEKAKRMTRELAHKVLKNGKFPIFIGGDHSVSIGVIEAVSHHFHNEITVLQLDAHTDMRDEYQGTPFSHACVARRASELCPVVQAGIRSSSEDEWKLLKKLGRLPITASFIRADIESATSQILTRIKTPKVYITIDVDCLDPSVMPATGTPEPGGIDWFDLLFILKKVAENFRVIGFDVVELAPVPGIHHPEFTCARLIYKMIGYLQQHITN